MNTSMIVTWVDLFLLGVASGLYFVGYRRGKRDGKREGQSEAWGEERLNQLEEELNRVKKDSAKR